MYKATVTIRLRPSILDPKGKATHQALHNLGISEIAALRMGKLIEMNVDAASEKDAFDIVQKACTSLLANEVMEDYEIEIN